MNHPIAVSAAVARDGIGPSLTRVSRCFVGGVVGGLANSVAVWLAGAIGATGMLGGSLAPVFTASWLYPRLVWGGLWGLLFLLPTSRMPTWARTAVFSLPPTLVQLFVIFPANPPAGSLGLGLGAVTPVVVLLANWLWAFVAAQWIEAARP